MKIKNSNSFDNMGGLIIGEVPISLIVLSALSVALSIFVIFLISSIRIKDSIVSDFRLEEELSSMDSPYDPDNNEKGYNIETAIRIPITRMNDVTAGLPVLLTFDQSPGCPTYCSIGYVRGVGFRVVQTLGGVEATALVNVSLDKSHINVHDYNHIGKTGQAELIFSEKVLGNIIIGSFIDHLSK